MNSVSAEATSCCQTAVAPHQKVAPCATRGWVGKVDSPDATSNTVLTGRQKGWRDHASRARHFSGRAPGGFQRGHGDLAVRRARRADWQRSRGRVNLMSPRRLRATSPRLFPASWDESSRLAGTRRGRQLLGLPRRLACRDKVTHCPERLGVAACIPWVQQLRRDDGRRCPKRWPGAGLPCHAHRRGSDGAWKHPPEKTEGRPPCWVAGLQKNDPALTYFRAMHYHRLRLLDCRVRKGNGYFQTDMGTGSCLENGFGRRGWWIREGSLGIVRVKMRSSRSTG